MNRDILFAEEVYKQCDENNYKIIINDGSKTIEELLKIVEQNFKIVR